MGEVAHCDFCQRHVEEVRDRKGIGLEDWSPEVRPWMRLLGGLGFLDRPGPGPGPDVRLHSLLTSVQSRFRVEGELAGPSASVAGQRRRCSWRSR